MKHGWSRVAASSTACFMLCCGGSDGGNTNTGPEAFDARCVQNAWGTSVISTAPPRIEVGATITVGIYVFGFDPLQERCVSRYLASVQWSASVPGIVQIRPGTRPEQAVIVGAAVGETKLAARITFTDGSTIATEANATVWVIPAAPR